MRPWCAIRSRGSVILFVSIFVKIKVQKREARCKFLSLYSFNISTAYLSVAKVQSDRLEAKCGLVKSDGEGLCERYPGWL